jgi:hypothetical protein
VVPEYILKNGNVSVTMGSDTVTSRGSGMDLQMWHFNLHRYRRRHIRAVGVFCWGHAVKAIMGVIRIVQRMTYRTSIPAARHQTCPDQVPPQHSSLTIAADLIVLHFRAQPEHPNMRSQAGAGAPEFCHAAKGICGELGAKRLLMREVQT